MTVTLPRMTERAKVTVGAGPHGHVAYSESQGRVWVVNGGSGTISILDGETGDLRDTIDVGRGPRHLILDDERGLAFVALDDGVAIVDASLGRVVTRLPVAAGNRATCLLPMLPRRMYVLGDAGALTIVDAVRQEVAGTAATGRGSSWGQPHEKSCGKLYVSNAGTNDMTILDEATETVIATVPVGRAPRRNAIFRERGLVYTANADDGSVTAVSIESDAVVATIPAGPGPFRLIGMEKKTGRPELWVLGRGSDDGAPGGVTVISATEHRVTGSIPVMDRPCNWLFQGPIAHVVGTGSRDLLLIDSRSSTAIGTGALTAEPDPASFSNMVFGHGGRLFIANADDTVSVLATEG
jgi:YVTN family beta-propeller protein